MCYMLKAYKRCTLKILYKFYFHVILVVQCFMHVFHNISMHFSCGNNTNPSINKICVNKTQTLLFNQVRDENKVFSFSPKKKKSILNFKILKLYSSIFFFQHRNAFLKYCPENVNNFLFKFVSTFLHRLPTIIPSMSAILSIKIAYINTPKLMVSTQPIKPNQ